MRPTQLLHRYPRLRRAAIAGILTPPALALFATQAIADGESISIVQNDPTVVAGQAANFTASGTLNPADTMFGFDVFLFVKDPDLDSTCGADLASEEATAMGSNGNEAWVSPPGGFSVGSSGTFSQPFKFTFSGAGHYLFCGYVESDFSTVASGEVRGVVTAAPSAGTGSGAGNPPTTPQPTPSPQPTPTPRPTPAPRPASAAPALVRAPRISRARHVLVCHGGLWSNSPSHLSYRWYMRGRARTITSGSALIERRSMTGHHVRCRVTARNAAGIGTATTRWVTVP